MEARPSAPEELEATEEQPGSSATSSGDSSDPLSEYFVRHKLTKLDTLAGLAVKYNVTVSDIKRANGMLADNAMFGKDTLLIPTRPLPVGPEYSTWAGMIVTHYGRLGPSDDAAVPSDSPYAHFSQNRALQQLRGFSSTGPSRSQSPQYGSGAKDSDRHHLFARGGGDWGSPTGQPQQVELMERSGRSTFAAAATYIEDRLRRRGRTDSQGDEGPSGSGGGGGGEGGAGGGGEGGFTLFHRAPLFSAGGAGSAGAAQAAALASAGGRQLRQWKESVLQKLKKVASQPALAVPPGASPGMTQLGAAAVASAPLLPGSGASPEGRTPSLRQRPTGGGAKAD
ncbi:hypothetical protein ABPG75_007556 [Micractinium tetrahymenae]